MTLGERIYQLRTEKSLSQGALADMLDVSRQSISKWETDSSVPELDKLVKFSDIFNVTLDELVSGKKPDIPLENTQTMSQAYTQASGFPPRKVAGTILLCMGFLVVLVIMVLEGSLWGFLYASPFVLCGITCFVFRKNVGLWCAWMVLLVTDLYLRITTAWSLIGSLIFAPYNLASNYRMTAWFIVSLVGLIYTIILVSVTAVRFRKAEYNITKLRLELFIGIVLFLTAAKIFFSTLRYYTRWLDIVYLFIDWGILTLVTVLLVYAGRYLYCKKHTESRT